MNTFIDFMRQIQQQIINNLGFSQKLGKIINKIVIPVKGCSASDHFRRKVFQGHKPYLSILVRGKTAGNS